MYIRGKIIKPGDDLSEAAEIRKEVFVKEYGIPYNQEFDNIDAFAVHALAYESMPDESCDIINNNIVVATGRLFFDGDICQIDKVCVLKEYRRKMYGDFIVRLLLNRAFIGGVDKVYVDAFISAENFFKEIGFIRESDNFIDNGIMKCRMKIETDNISRKC